LKDGFIKEQLRYKIIKKFDFNNLRLKLKEKKKVKYYIIIVGNYHQI
jgi:hypothetical protein